MRDFLKILWCRVAYGHMMIPYGNVRSGTGSLKTMYMCARCNHAEHLYCIGRVKDCE